MKKFSYDFKALGTSINIIIIGDDEYKADQTLNNLYNYILSFENEFSRFKPDSQLSILNKKKKLKMSGEFLGLILACKEIYKLTNGYFNPLTDIRTHGYINNFEDGNFEILNSMENLNFDYMKIYGNTIEISESMNLDFGAIGKGYLADKIKEKLINLGFENFIINIGGDIVVNGLNSENQKWNIGIMSPFNEGNICNISITNYSVSTSGTYLRKWKINDKEYSHIKNPISVNDNSVSSVTILDKFGYRTDGIATGVFNMGTKMGIDFCNEKGLDGLIIENNGKIFYTKDFDIKYNLKIIR